MHVAIMIQTSEYLVGILCKRIQLIQLYVCVIFFYVVHYSPCLVCLSVTKNLMAETYDFFVCHINRWDFIKLLAGTIRSSLAC